MKYALQQVIDLTSLMGRLDSPAIQTALLNDPHRTATHRFLALVLRQEHKRAWQLNVLKKQNLSLSQEQLAQVEHTLFDNKIPFKMMLRTSQIALPKVGHSPFHLKSPTRMNEGRWE